MSILSAKNITVLCCRVALDMTLICMLLSWAAVGLQHIDLPKDLVELLLLFCLPYVAGEVVARMLANNRVAGVWFMILTVVVAACRLYAWGAYAYGVLQLRPGVDGGMIGLLIVFDFWMVVVQWALTAPFAGYAVWQRVAARLERP